MNSTNDELKKQLEKVLTGRPWYGSSVETIINSVNSNDIYKKISAEHSMAELLIHMIAWTEEVTERLAGKTASDPERGDWPAPKGEVLDDLAKEFYRVNSRLSDAVQNFPSERWDDYVPDNRSAEEPRSTFKETVEGLINHHVYHLGQISILNKQYSG